MLRSTIRRLRRTLSFRSRKKKKDEGVAKDNWEQDGESIKGTGIIFPCKYLGAVEVSESRGTQVCSQAAHQMKMNSAGKKKQRVTLCVTEDTLRVTDDQTKIMVVDQVIEKVSFCTPDPNDDKLFSYISRDGTSRRWMCHSFRGIKDTGERISHAVGCAFASCLAKKQAQNQLNENGVQREAASRKTLEPRPNGVKLPQQSVDTLQKLNRDEYELRVEKASQVLIVTKDAADNDSSEATQETAASSPSPSKQPISPFARPRPNVGLDAAAFKRHASLPYRTKKATTTSGSATYQALIEDPLPPRGDFITDTEPPGTDVSAPQPDFWLQTESTNNHNNFSPPNNSSSLTPCVKNPSVLGQQPIAANNSFNPFVKIDQKGPFDLGPFEEKFV